MGKITVHKGGCQLDLALAADVVKDNIIAVLDAAHRLPVAIETDQRL